MLHPWKRVWKSRAIAPFVLVGLAIALILAWPVRAIAQDIIRYPIPNSTFPIALAVELPADANLVYVSGQVPPLVNSEADPNSVEAFGDTQTQTVNVIERIQTILTSLDLSLSDVVKMQVFLVGDPSMDGKMDFAGFMAGYTQYFGTEEQPNLPARSAMQVAGLVNPGWLVEIEVVAVRS
ncbi:RidA family protein [Leptolyngbya sp. AN02str]|uniref:RidA family protein n=1 Tax=Leptolyngbya sp. AN02str TaxID=3423363 RepID=UPI003D3190F5